jgi:hypothetical protein
MSTERPALPEQVRVGAHVEVELIDERGAREPMAFDLVREQFADLAQGQLGIQTPLAKAILGKAEGMIVAYRMGDIHQVHIVRVTAAQSRPLENAAEKRATALQQAREQVERTNAEIFAASYSGKWGDYQMRDSTTETGTNND